MSRNQRTLASDLRPLASTYPALVAQLDELRGRWRLLQLGDGLLRLLAVLAGAIVLAVACDNLFWPGRTGRAMLLTAVGIATLMALFNWLVRRWLEERRDDYFAALVERQFPALQNRLINGLQLGRGNDYGSPRLIEAIVNDAAALSSELDLTTALDRRPVRRAGGWLAAAGMVLFFYAFSPRFANGFSRVLLPLADIPPYTATRIAAVMPGDGQVLEGQPVSIEATLAGDIPASAQLILGGGETQWKILPMQSHDRKRPERYGFALREATESFDYYVAAGDGVSRQYHIEVVARPRVEKLALEITPPPYTRRSAEVIDPSDGEIAAWTGSAVRLTLTASKPLKSARLLLDAGEPIELARSDERTWQTTLTISTDKANEDALPSHRRVIAPARYRIQLAATDGADLNDPLWHSIVALDDQPPSIAIVRPGRDVQLKPDEMLELEVVAKDDFGVGAVKLLYRVNDEKQPRELAAFAADAVDRTQWKEIYAWKLADGSFKAGDLLQYWAEAADRNDVTGPGTARSQIYSVYLKTPEQTLARLEFQLDDYAQALEELIRLQSENRAQTASGVAFETLLARQTLIRGKTLALSRAIGRDAAPVATMIASLDELYAGPMADCIRLLEAGRDTADVQRAYSRRDEALPVEDEIIERLKELLARLQRNEQARKSLKKLEKTDQAAHTAIIEALSKLAGDLHGLLSDENELVEKFERLPKKPVDEANEEAQEAMDDLNEFAGKWNQWTKGKVDELTKLPTGFVDDFGLREDVNSVFEEIERAAQRAKAEKIEVALEDLGAGLGTKMLEDLEVWMLDAPDAAQWVLEEPLASAGLKVPEMPLPDALEDMVGELLQEADEFDQEADDITSAWGDNLNQAGWGVADGPISSFSAKGKTGNDLPNNMELSGRSGDGRRGKSSGQMVGDTSRGLAGRKTPARVGAERYEPGKLKEETPQDPNGATGGGKKAGAGRRGLQGGTPPDFVKDMQRLSEKQAAVRDKAEQVAQRLEAAGVTTTRLDQSIELMKSAESDLRDLRYEDAAAKRRVALGQLKGAFSTPDRATAAQISRARDLPAELRDELLQSADEAYPPGYESLLKHYFKSLSEAEK